MSDVGKLVELIKEEGLVILPEVYSGKQCEKFVLRCEDLKNKLLNKNFNIVSNETIFIINYFRHDNNLLDLLSNSSFDKLLRQLIDQDYVLAASNLINKTISNNICKNAISPGRDWHTDSRIVGGKRLAEGFSYQVIVMLEDFNCENGATQYIPGSHLTRKVPERNGNYEYKNIEGLAGSVVIMDSGTWHRSGPASNKSRWGVFSLYTPWFMKPYYRYPEMLGDQFGENLSPVLKQILHYDSIPPLNDEERIATLKRIGQ